MIFTTNKISYTKNIMGTTIIDSINISEESILKYIDNINKKYDKDSNIETFIFGNKEFIKNLLEINFNNYYNIDSLVSNCNIYVFIILRNDDLNIFSINDENLVLKEKEDETKMKLIINDQIYVNNVGGVSFINYTKKDFVILLKYFTYFISGFGGCEHIKSVTFGNKEQILKHMEINNYFFKDFKNLITDCDIYIYIELNNNEVIMVGVEHTKIITELEKLLEEK